MSPKVRRLPSPKSDFESRIVDAIRSLGTDVLVKIAAVEKSVADLRTETQVLAGAAISARSAAEESEKRAEAAERAVHEMTNIARREGPTERELPRGSSEPPAGGACGS